MRIPRLSCLPFVFLGLAPVVLAEEAAVKILAPAEGARLGAMAQNRISYDVTPGPRGDHTHLYVDGREVAVLRKLKGEHALGGLARGDHDLCIRVVDKGHAPIGVEKCVKVNAQ